MAGFFDNYERFAETSQTASSISRLNFRFNLIIEQNVNRITGKKILDIASHDGRWAFAAIKGAEAGHVTGIEAREHLIMNATETFNRFGVSADRYDFICGDVYEQLPKLVEKGARFDTAMILGFLYHTPRHYELLSAVSRLGCRDVIIDSRVIPHNDRAIVVYRFEGTGRESQIFSKDRKKVLSADLTVAAAEHLFREFGYQLNMVRSSVEIPSEECRDYKKGRRVTFVGTRN